MKRQDPTFRAQRKRRDRPDADQRHGRTAPGGDQAPPAARFQPERARAQAARQLSRDGRARGRGDRHMPSPAGRAVAVRRSDDPHRAVSAGRQPARWSCRPAATCCPSRICRPCIDVLDRAGPRRRAARLPADAGENHGASAGRCTRPSRTRSRFAIAAADAFNKGLQAAGTVLLGADHEAANHHARGPPGRFHQRPAAAAGR